MPRRYPLHGWVIGIFSGAVTLAALVAGSIYGNGEAKTFNPKLVAWVCAAAIVGFGILATARLSTALSRLMARRNAPAFEGAVKFLSAAVGYLFVGFAALAVLQVSLARLLVGAGVAGIVLGIAAQQSLGNIFAGLVLILSRPFVVGDHIRIRSGALGGIFDAWVLEMSLVYVTVRTDDGELKIPNTAMLAAGVGRLPRHDAPPKRRRGRRAEAAAAAAAAQASTAPTAPTPAPPAPTAGAQAAPAQVAAEQPALVSTDGGQAASAQVVVPQTEATHVAPPETKPTATAPAKPAATKTKRRVGRPRAGRLATIRAKANREEPAPAPPPGSPGGPEAQ